MPNWKKVILSGSDAHLADITASGDVLVSSSVSASDFRTNNIKIRGSIIESSGSAPGTDTDVFVELSNNGFDFAAGPGDKFKFNVTDQDNVDFQIAGNSDTEVFYVDASSNNVGLGISSPNQYNKLHVSGSVLVSPGSITCSNDITGSGMLFASLSENIFDEAAVNLRTVVYAPEGHSQAGKFFFTSAFAHPGTGGGGGGSMNNFTLTADGGSNQTIANGNTLDIAGGTNITTAVGNTDTVTVNLDDRITVTDVTASNISLADSIVHTGDTNTKIAFGTDTITFTAGGNTNTTLASTLTTFDQNVVGEKQGQFINDGTWNWGGNTGVSGRSGFRTIAGVINKSYSHLTPQTWNGRWAMIGMPVNSAGTKFLTYPSNFVVYGNKDNLSMFVNPGNGADPEDDDPGGVKPDIGGGGNPGVITGIFNEVDATGKKIGVPTIQLRGGDLEIVPSGAIEGGNTAGIRIASGDVSGSFDPGIFFYNRDNKTNISGSFFYESASAEIRFDSASNAIKFLSGDTNTNLQEILHVSRSGNSPRIGIGTNQPIRAFDFKEVRDDNKGGEILIRGSRTTKGAENNDEVGRINFAIDSASFGKITTSGSAAEIVAIVDDIDPTGVEGSLSFRVSSGKEAEAIERIKLIGNPDVNAVLITGSTAFDTDVTIGNDLTVSDFALLNSVRIGSTDIDPGDGVLRVEDYGVFEGGLKVGSSEDPGTNNLIVDGTTTLKGVTNIGNATGDTLTVSGSVVNLPSVVEKGTLSATDNVLILDGDRVKQTPQTSLPFANILDDGGIPPDQGIAMFTGSSGKTIVEVPGITYNAAAGLSFSNAGSLADLTAGPVIINTLLGNVTSSGNISSSGDITANSFNGIFDGALSSSAQIASDISGSFTAASASFSTRVTANEVVTAKTLVSSSAQIASDISGSFTAASASLAADIVTNAGNIGTTTNALTVDNATLQLNSGTTFNGSAARTISIKDGGVDSDALAADISLTSVTASRFRGDGRDLTNIPNDLVWDGTVGDGRLTIITCQRFLETGFQTETQNINTSSLEYTDTGIGVAITSPVIYARDHDDAEITNNISLASTPYIVFSGSNFQINSTLEAASGDLIAKIDLNELDHDNDGVITDTKLLKSIKDKLLELKNNSTFNKAELNYNIQDSYLKTANTGQPHQIAVSNFDAASPDNTNVFSFHYFTSESSRRGGGAETTQIFNITTNPNKVYSSLITDLDTTFSSSLEITGSLTLADGTLAIPGFANVSSSLASVVAGNIGGGIVSGAAQIDSLINDTIAATIVAEIDNDEIPIAKLAEDSISGVALGSNLNNLTVDNATLQLNSGTTYNGSAARTISIKDGGVDSDALAANISVTGLTATNVTASGNISASGKIITSELSALGDLTIDADGADIILSDGGTDFGRFKRDTSDFVIKSETNNKDIIFKGVDDSSTITALTLDMSDAGKAIFNDGIVQSNNKFLTGTETGGTTRNILGINSSDVTQVANANIATNIKGTSITLASSVTASIISASSDVMADRYFLQGTRILANSGTEIQINETTLPININGPSINLAAPVTASGNISSSGDLISNTLDTKTNKLAKTSNTDADHQGDVVFFGGTTSMTAGKIYHYNSSGNWELSNATDNTKSTGLLAVALGAASDTNGMLLKGMVTLDHDPGAVGDKLFLRTSNGLALNSAPGSTGNVIRVIGYCLDASNGQIYFNPSNDHIVHA